MRRLWRMVKWIVRIAVILLVLLLAPSAYVEMFCRGDTQAASHDPIITDAAFQRAEANSYLTYPEWHIVYAYEDLARVLETDDEYAFGYTSSVTSFWQSFCALNREAAKHGGADFNTRGTIHVIGVSFTLEMALKALYEETLGRLTAIVRGQEKTLQDDYAAQMAADYAGFLRQTPWYKFDFDGHTSQLWALPVGSSGGAAIRGWERRLALGGEWKAKAAYAKAIAGAVAAAGQAQLRIRSVINGLEPDALSQIAEVDVIEAEGNNVIIETPRYRAFTGILRQIAQQGGQIVEIAGNDDIMVSLLAPTGNDAELANGEVIFRAARDGSGDDRVLVTVKLAALAPLLAELEAEQLSLEHIYDY